MEIRHINSSDDKAAICRIYEESWKYVYRGIIPQDFLDVLTESHWADKIDVPERNTLVCIEDGKYIGTSSYGNSRFEAYPDAGEVFSIYLLPDYMRRGYGSKLMDAVLYDLRKQGFKEVFLWVLEENRRARRFYEKYGFECSNEYMETNVGGKNLGEVRYVYRFA